MTCQALTEINTVADFFIYPTTCFYWFWLIIILAITFLVAWRIFKIEEDKNGKGDFLGACAISSLAFTILAGFGTLVQSSSGIPMIQTDIMMYLLALAIPLNIFFIFRRK